MLASDLGEPARADSWADIARDSCRMGVDAAGVVWLRTLRLAGGGKEASSEAMLMVAEKWCGHAAYAKELGGGRLGSSCKEIASGTIAFYGCWLRDNRQRLAGGG